MTWHEQKHEIVFWQVRHPSSAPFLTIHVAKDHKSCIFDGIN